MEYKQSLEEWSKRRKEIYQTYLSNKEDVDICKKLAFTYNLTYNRIKQIIKREEHDKTS